MLGRKQKKIEELQRRVEELEERLCPLNKHDWVEIDSYYTSFTNVLDFGTIHVYKCSRCGKKSERIN
jgi:hypothetical protein